MERALRDVESSFQLQQAPHGLDRWDERDFQQAFASAFGASCEVTREAYYPASAGRPRTHRERCDLVLTPRGTFLPEEGTLPFAPCPAEAASWIELKLAHQFAEGGAANRGYAGEWKQVVSDFHKLASDAGIRHGAAVLIVFTADEPTLQRDLATFEAVFLPAWVVAPHRSVRSVPIWDRIGHQVLSVVVWTKR